MSKSIILFDGYCNLCSGAVQFILKRDKKEYFRYGSLQSEKGKELRERYHISDDVDSIVLIENDKAFVKSTAALRIARHLKGWKWLWAFIIIPPFLRNLAYDFIAHYRYKWFGKRDTCMMPERPVSHLFLDGNQGHK